MHKKERFVFILKEIMECIENETYKIDNGVSSEWERNQLQFVVRPEMYELLTYALKGKVFFKYGKKQRLLASTYLITDSLSGLSKTKLGSKI